MSYVLEVKEASDGELSLNLPEEIHNELGWIPVEKHPCSVLIRNYYEPFVYCFNTNTKVIKIGKNTFSDWDDLDDIDIENLSKNLLEVKKQNEDQILITVIDKIDFVKNEKEICELVEISVFKEHKQYILDLSDTIQKTDFSVLANVSNEKIREEKSKMYKTIINKCK